MALQIYDGFDDYGTGSGVANAAFNSRVIVHGQIPAFGTTGAAFGGQAANIVNMNCEIEFPLPTAVGTFIIGTRLYFTVNSSVGMYLVFSDTSDNVLVQIQLLSMNGVNTLSATRNGAHGQGTITGTALGSASYLTAVNTYYEIEAQLTVGSGTSGSLLVKINGATILNLSGINTQGTAGSTIGFVGFGAAWPTGSCWDDFYGCDTTGSAPYNTFGTAVAGPMGYRVSTGVPNGNSSVQFTPSTGTNYSNVNETTYSSTNYNSSGTPGQTDLFTIAAPISSGSTILAVQNTFVGALSAAGTRTAAGVIKSGGTNYAGTTRTLTATPTKYVDIWVNDPATGSPWATSKFTGTPSVNPGYTCVS